MDSKPREQRPGMSKTLPGDTRQNNKKHSGSDLIIQNLFNDISTSDIIWRVMLDFKMTEL